MGDATDSTTGGASASSAISEREIVVKEKLYELECAKLSWEKQRSSGLRSLLNENLGIAVTAIIGIATITVSYLQLEITKSSGERLLNTQKETAKAQLDLETSKAAAAKDKDQRAFQFELARMLLEKQKDINTEDIKQVTGSMVPERGSEPPSATCRMATGGDFEVVVI